MATLNFALKARFSMNFAIATVTVNMSHSGRHALHLGHAPSLIVISPACLERFSQVPFAPTEAAAYRLYSTESPNSCVR
jgi:hypothetical protein